MSNVRDKKYFARNAMKIKDIYFKPDCMGIFIAFAYKNLDTIYSGL
jgi:hypothetical protein